MSKQEGCKEADHLSAAVQKRPFAMRKSPSVTFIDDIRKQRQLSKVEPMIKDKAQVRVRFGRGGSQGKVSGVDANYGEL